jgi:hypothetical protein
MPHYGYPFVAPGSFGHIPRKLLTQNRRSLRSSPQPYWSFRSGQWVVSSLSESECLLPLWTKSPAGGWVQDGLWKTFSGFFATMPGLLFRLGPMVLSES